MDAFVKYVIPAGSGFITGIALFSLFRSFTPFLIVSLFFISYLSAGIYSGYFFNRYLISFSLIIFFIWTGGFYTNISTEEALNNPERVVKEEEVLIVSEEEKADSFSRYTARTENGLSLLLTTFSYPKFPYGTKVKISGEIREPPVFDDFNYKAYLKKEGIDAVVYFPEIEMVKKPNPSLKGTVLSFKDSLRSALRSSLPYPHNTIAGAMILGDGDRVPEKVGALFSAVGIRHIIAISGLHVTIIAGLFLAFFSSFLRVGRNVAFWATSSFVFLFVFFVGAPPSAIRAGIMALIFLFSFKIGKPYSAPRALFVTAIIMLAVNPMLLIHDIGFQLSFLAVLGMFYITPHIEKTLGKERSFLEEEKRVSKKSGLVSLFSVSIGAHLATLPLVAYNFGLISLSAPFINIIAVPLLPVIVISGFSGALLGTFSEILGQISSFPAFLGIEIILITAKIIDKLPLSSMEVNVPFVWAFLSYILLILLFWQLKLKRPSISKTSYPSDFSLHRENKPF
ncbi:MAG: ComEC/Rec2 family competence protein [Patescibacteria group bacterium]